MKIVHIKREELLLTLFCDVHILNTVNRTQTRQQTAVLYTKYFREFITCCIANLCINFALSTTNTYLRLHPLNVCYIPRLSHITS
jgi:hypothetical protein